MYIAVILGMVAAAVGVILSISIFNGVTNGLACPDAVEEPEGFKHCQATKNTAWTMLAVLPVGLFFSTFWLIKVLSEGPY